jgi:aryl sulfotransferase
VVWSMYNHHANANDFWYHALNDTPGRVGPPIERPTPDIVQYYKEWLDKDGFPFWPFWENIRTWWAIRNLPNVHLIHFGKLKEDMPGEIKRLAAFLNIQIDPAKWDAILEHCSFDYMKKHSTRSVPLGGAFWDGGSDTFINKGVNGRWREVLSKEDSERYEQMCLEKLDEACTRWLNTGEI